MSSGGLRPAEPLVEVLAPAMAPCPEFAGRCSSKVLFAPHVGHVPRGFAGALGLLEGVQLVIVAAEPGPPLPGESNVVDPANPREAVAQLAAFTYEQLDRRVSVYQVNMRAILDLCWRGYAVGLREQLKRTWITDSVLCSSPSATGDHHLGVRRACRERYLDRQLALLRGRPVLALGSKAQARLRAGGWDFVGAYAAARPGCNSPKAFPSWRDAANKVRAALGLPQA